MAGERAGNSTNLNPILDLARNTELNGVVIDVKDGFGKVDYASSIPEVQRSGACEALYDAEAVIGLLHTNNIYVIGRIVCFRDPWLASNRTDLAIKQCDGAVWKENGTTPWANPYKEEVWKYNISIAKEAVAKGFDEIQFDYARFPSGRSTNIAFGIGNPPKADAIRSFLRAAGRELCEGKRVKLSADVFGIVCQSLGDRQEIGQDLERLGWDLDYVCPMVYPALFANWSRGKGGNGVGQSINGILFTAPDLKPYEVVYNTLARCKSRISTVPGYRAKIRQYLQAF